MRDSTPNAQDGLRRPGSVAVMQYLRDGVVRVGIPVRVIEDSPDRSVLYLASGTEVGRKSHVTPTRSYSPTWNETHVVMITEVGAMHSVWAMWFADSWEFHCWYVNLQDPIRRTSQGYMTRDLSLDIVIYADGQWRWKDEDETQNAIEQGVLTREDVGAARTDGERVLQRWRAEDPPFSEDWPSWRPKSTWTTPELPTDWALL